MSTNLAFCNKKNSRKIGKIQERSLRFVYDDFNSTDVDLLAKANIQSLHIRRLKTMTNETFKILNNMSPPVLSDLISLRQNSTYNFRYNNILQILKLEQVILVRKVLGTLQQFY